MLHREEDTPSPITLAIEGEAEELRALSSGSRYEFRRGGKSLENPFEIEQLEPRILLSVSDPLPVSDAEGDAEAEVRIEEVVSEIDSGDRVLDGTAADEDFFAYRPEDDGGGLLSGIAAESGKKISDEDSATSSVDSPPAVPGGDSESDLSATENPLAVSTVVFEMTETLHAANGPPAVEVTLDETAEGATVLPTVLGFVFDGGGAQRSLVTQFSDDVGATLSAGDLLLRNLTTGEVLDSSIAVSYDGVTNTATWAFPGFFLEGLEDGTYFAKLLSSGIANAAGAGLDGNGDGMPGGDYVFDLFAYFGDLSGESNDTFFYAVPEDDFDSGPVNGENLHLSRQNVDGVEIFALRDGEGETLATGLISEIGSIEIRGLDSVNDTLTIDFTNGDFGIPIDFYGGVAGFDTLVLIGGSFATADYLATGPDSGSIAVGETVIRYTGLEPISDNMDIDARIIQGTTGDDRIRVKNDPVDGRLAVESDNGTFESISFGNPSTSLTIRGLAGNDTIIVEALDPSFSATLFVDGGPGSDALLDSFGVAATGIANIEIIATGIPEWVAQGPGPITGGQVAGIADQPVTGAINAIAAHPANPAIIYVGTVNGGIWRTIDGGTNWEPLTDQFPALSITAMAFDPSDSTNQTLYAGTGRGSSSGLGGKAIGLLKTVDGGATWTLIRKSFFEDRQITSIVALMDGTVVVATEDLAGISGRDPGGVFRSVDGGATFLNLSRLAGSGLPVGAVTDLEVDPANANRLYAALPGHGIFRTENAGDTWVDTSGGVAGVASSIRIELSISGAQTAGRNPIYAAVIAGSPNVIVTGLFRSADLGVTWAAMDLPGDSDGGVNPGGQGDSHFSILADRDDPFVVFVGGDRQAAPAGMSFLADGSVANSIGATNYTGRLFRGDASQALGFQWTAITDNGANGTGPHADSRDMVFDASGRILQADDGGIYRLLDPNNSSTRVWESVNGVLALTELYSVAWVADRDLILGGAQDVGVALQSLNGSLLWNALAQGDGGIVQTAERSLLPDLLFYSNQQFGGFTVSGVTDSQPDLLVSGTSLSLFGFDNTIQFIQPYVLNAIDPSRIFIGTNYLYESIPGLLEDPGDTLTLLNGAPVAFGTATFAAPFAASVGRVNALVYGGREPDGAGGLIDKPDIGYVGTDGDPRNGDRLFVRQGGALGAFVPVVSYPGGAVRDLAVDQEDWRRIFVLDDRGQVWFSSDGGSDPSTAWTWTQLTGNLGSLPGGQNLQKIAVDSASGEDVILVGGAGGLFRKVGSGGWAEFGAGLPNVLVTDIDVVSGNDDLLLVGTLGRGAWTIGGVSQSLHLPSILSLEGSDGVDDVFELERNLSQPWLLDVFHYNSGAIKPLTPTFSIALASISGIEIWGRGGDDAFIVNFANGPIAVADNITIDGGSGSDTLTLQPPATDPTRAPLYQTGVQPTGPDSGLHVFLGPDAFGEIAGQWVTWTGVESASETTLVAGSDVDLVRAGLESTAEALRQGLAEALRGIELAGIDAQSLADALNGIRIEPPRPKNEPFLSVSQVAPEGFAQLDNGSSVLLRLIEEGTGAFELSDISGDGAINDPAALRQALDDLDDIPNNVSLITSPDGSIIFNVQIVKRLTGIVDLDVAADIFGGVGDVRLTGGLEIGADVALNLSFGVDDKGFYLEPDPAVSELVVTNLSIEGEVLGSGRVGFLGVDLNGATLSMDPDVEVRFDLSDPGTDPVDGADGKIRIPELTAASVGDLIAASVSGDPGDGSNDDAVLTGFFTVGAVVPGFEAPFDLADEQLELVWSDFAEPGEVRIRALLQAGGDWFDFLAVTSQEVLDALKDFRDHLTVFGVEIPFLQDPFDELIGLADQFQRDVLDSLSIPLTGAVAFSTAQELAAALAGSLHIPLDDLALAYDATSGELSYDIAWDAAFSGTGAADVSFDAAGGLAALQFNGMGMIDAAGAFRLTLGLDLKDLATGADLNQGFFIRDASASGTADLTISDLDAAARFGFLGVDVVDGSGTLNAAFSVSLRDSGTRALDGRIELGELIDGLENPRSLLVGPVFTGSAIFELPLAAPFLGIAPSADTTMTVAIPDLSDLTQADVTLPATADFDQIRSYENLTLSDVIGALREIKDYLVTLEGFSFLGQPLPLLNHSVADVIDFAGRFLLFLQAFESEPAATLQETEMRLEEALGLAPDSPLVTFTASGDDLLIDLVFETRFSGVESLELDLAALAGLVSGGVPGLQGLGKLVAVDGSADLQVDAGFALDLDFGFDLSDPAAPDPFLRDTTSALIDLFIDGADLEFRASVGGIGFFVAGGSGRLDQDGNAQTSAPAILTLDIANDDAGDNRYSLDELSTSLAILDFDGGASAVLPVYFPIRAVPLGGEAPANHLEVSIADLSNPAGTTTIVTPDISAISFPGPDSLSIDDVDSLLVGLQALVAWAEALDEFSYLGQPLPLVGLTVGEILDFGDLVRQVLKNPVETFLTTDLTPTTAELLGVLKGLSGNYGGLIVTVNPSNVSGGKFDAVEEIRFDLSIQARRTERDLPLSLGADAAAYGISMDADIDVTFDTLFDLAFGLDLTPGLPSTDRFFVEFQKLEISGGISTSSFASAVRVGLLEGTISGGVIDLELDLDVNVVNTDGDGEGQVTATELEGSSVGSIVDLAVTGLLDVNLPVTASVGTAFSTSGSIFLSDSDLFSDPAPRFGVIGFEESTNFKNLSAADVLRLIKTLADQLSGPAFAEVYNTQIPFTGRTVGQVVDVAAAFADNLIAWLENGEGDPTFDSVQGLVAQLDRIPGLDLATINPRYDAVTDEFRVDIAFTDSFSLFAEPLSFDLDLAPLGNVTTNRTVRIDADLNVAFTLGFDLSDISTGPLSQERLFIENASLNAAADFSATSITASALVGFVRVNVGSGTATADGMVEVDLKDPATGMPGGRVTLNDLFSNLVLDPASVLDATISGTAHVEFANIAVMGGLAASPPPTARIIIDVPDFGDPTTASIAFDPPEAFDEIFKSEGIGFREIVDALVGIRDYLRDIAGAGFLSQKIPLLNRSLSEIIDYAGQFSAVVDAFENDAASSLQDVENKLKSALGLSQFSNDVDLRVVGADILVDLIFRSSFSDTMKLNLALESFAGLAIGGSVPALEDVLDLIALEAGGDLNVTAEVTFNLNFGLDISTPSSPVAFVADTTSLTATLRATATNLNFEAAVGPLGVFIKNGTATLDGDGNPFTSDQAVFTVDLLPDGGDGRYLLPQLSTSLLDIDLTGGVAVTLPLYFPTMSEPLGGDEAANDLVITIADLADFLNGAAGSVVIESPDISQALEDFDIGSSLDSLLSGLDLLFRFLEDALDGEVFGIKLPVVGDKLKEIADIIGSFRDDLLGAIAALDVKSAVAVRQAILDSLGPGLGGSPAEAGGSGATQAAPGAGLGLLGDRDKDGDVDLDDILLISGTDEVFFDFELGGTLVSTSDIDFDLGLPGLGFELDAEVRVVLTWSFALGFGVRRGEGFYFDTSRVDEMFVEIKASLPGLDATGSLIFLSLNVTDSGAERSTLAGSFAIDFQDPSGNNRLTSSELVSGAFGFGEVVVPRANDLTADIDLVLRVRFPGEEGAKFPSLVTNFVVIWELNPFASGTDRAPWVAFEDVRLDLGSFFSDFVGPVLEVVNQVLEPVRPLIDALQTRVPILSDFELLATQYDEGQYGDHNGEVSLLEVMLVETPEDYLSDGAKTFIRMVADVDTFIRNIPSTADGVLIPLGRLDLSGQDP